MNVYQNRSLYLRPTFQDDLVLIWEVMIGPGYYVYMQFFIFIYIYICIVAAKLQHTNGKNNQKIKIPSNLKFVLY